MAPHSSTLAWKIPWMEEPGRMHSMRLLGVGHDWVTSLWLFTFIHRRRRWQPTPVFLSGESGDGGAWWAAISGVSQSRTRLKQLSSSSNCNLHECYSTIKNSFTFLLKRKSCFLHTNANSTHLSCHSALRPRQSRQVYWAFSKHLLTSYLNPHIVLSAGDGAMRKKNRPFLWGFYSLEEDIHKHVDDKCVL